MSRAQCGADIPVCQCMERFGQTGMSAPLCSLPCPLSKRRALPMKEIKKPCIDFCAPDILRCLNRCDTRSDRHSEKQTRLGVPHERQIMRDLSDILIEIALHGLKHPKFGHSEAIHPLMFLAHVAWNQKTEVPGGSPHHHLMCLHTKEHPPSGMDAGHDEKLTKSKTRQFAASSVMRRIPWGSLLS